MRIRASIEFWGEGVACFCHEAVARALRSEFAEVTIDETDLAYEKFLRAAQHPQLKQSAWFEFLRNGPRHRFTISDGISGVFSRYEIVFELDGRAELERATVVRGFLSKLSLGPIIVEDDA